MKKFLALVLLIGCGSPGEQLNVEWYDGLPDQCGLTGSETLSITVMAIEYEPHGKTSVFAWIGDTDDRVVLYDIEYDGGARGIMADRVAKCTQNFYVR